MMQLALNRDVDSRYNITNGIKRSSLPLLTQSSTSNSSLNEYSNKVYNKGQMRLCLKPENAVHVKDIKDTKFVSSKSKQNKIADPDLNLLGKFKTHPLRKYGDMLIMEFFVSSEGLKSICSANNDHLPPKVLHLCRKYLYGKQDELYQLAFILYVSLQKLHKLSLNKRLLNIFIEHYLCLNKKGISADSKKRKVKYYRHELCQANYIKNVNYNLYTISMNAKLNFDGWRKYSD